jgi:chitinase
MKKLLTLGLLILSTINVFGQLPNPAMVGYWENWTAGSFIYLSEVDLRYNVIMVSFASYKGDNDYEMDFVPEPGKYWQDSTLFQREMIDLQSAGKKVMLSIGGATYPIMLDSLAEKDGFVSSVGGILNQWNFDGLDIDLEGSSLKFQDLTIDSIGDPRLGFMIDAIKEIMTNYHVKHGKKMLLTMAPETHYVQGGMSEDLVLNNHGGAYLPMIEALRDSIDMLNIQLYNSGSMPGLDGTYYDQSTPDFILALTEAVIKGFTAASELGSYSGLPPSKIGVGLPSCKGWGFTEPKVLDKTMRYLLGKGPKPGSYSLLQEGGYPSLRGMMTWSINTDANCDDAHSFVNLYDQLFNGVSYLNISNPDTILITEENGGIILVEVENDSFTGGINPSHWTVTNLPNGVAIDTILSVNDSLVKIVLVGNSSPGTEQFHIRDVTVTVIPEAFAHATDTLTKNFGVELTSPGYFLPTRIEAENFHHIFGSEIRPTTDTDNNIKIGGGNTGAYSDYNIIVPETKTYVLHFRYATPMNNKADYSILVDGVQILRDTLESTGGWDSFETIYHEIELTEGKHQFRVYINLGWYGLNWFEIKEDGVGIKQLSDNQITFYPNPVVDFLQFKNWLTSPPAAKISISDITGKIVCQSLLTSNKIDVSRFLPGIYQVVIKQQNGSMTTGRFVKK